MTIKNKTLWSVRDIVFWLIFLLATISLLNIFGNGLTNVVAATDRDCKIYGDFQEYYYPAALTILKHPRPLGGYFYTPTFAISLHYLIAGPLEKALIRWELLQLLFLALILIIPTFYLAEKSGKKLYGLLYTFFLVTSYAVFHNLKWGQVSILITFLCIFSLILYDRKRRTVSALCLALAATVKYYPGFLILGFFIKKDWQYLAWFSGFLLILALIIPGAVLGFATTIEFYRLSLAEMSYALDWVSGDINSQFFPHVLMRLFNLPAQTKGFLSLIGMLACLFVFFRIYKTHEDFDIEQFSQLFLLVPFLINTSWPHYFVFLPFCGIIALIKSQNSKAKILACTALILQTITMLAIFPSYKEYSFSGILLFSNILILISLNLRSETKVPGNK
ncbi:MAG: hypothetical protein Kow0029_00840 [Candidatus Rifleibacteriota bacterium]